MHIIEAVGTGTPLTMSEISKSLGVTMGTLSTGINGLVKKGYVTRNRSQKDKRIVYASLTQKGIRAFQHHKKFHEDMVKSIMEEFDEQEAVILTKTFKKLQIYFSKWPK
jgi:DNA-binding MarR family transcriptional regulator